MRTDRWLALTALLALTVGCSPDPDAPAATPLLDRRPRFESDGRWLGYVANRHSDSISVLDLDALTELGRVPVGRDPVEIDGPRSLVLDPESELAYVTLSYPFEVTSPHAEKFGAGLRQGFVQQLNLSDLRILAELRVDARALDLALDPEHHQLAVSHYDELKASSVSDDLEQRRSNIALIDSSAWHDPAAAQMARVPTCVAPSALVYGADRSRVFIACTGEDALVVLDTSTLSVLARVPAGDQNVNKPLALAADPARERLLVVNQISRRVSVFGMTDVPELSSSLVLEGIPRAAAWVSGSEIFVISVDPARVVRLDPNTGSVRQTVELPVERCSGPNDVQQLEDGRVFLICAGNGYTPGSVVELEASTLEIARSVEVGIFPDRLAVRAP